ncbi:MAG: hypothetical protein R3190_19745 [Thermoanaerobaculia bacterium]|nr:hypothetical protein [Thermoanaerobaculia bacterium]
MDVPSEVLIHNATIGMKGEEGTLLRIADGYYEVNCSFGSAIHRILLPVASTVVISKSEEETFDEQLEIER